MIELIAQGLNQNLTPLDPTDVLFYFDPNTRNTSIVHFIDGSEAPIAEFLLEIVKSRRCPVQRLETPHPAIRFGL
ncbi:MAG: hypothetical protein AAGF93_11745 [Cyanobacteria bacterium P01_H01_bin.105]